jgi:hypothetical protein
VVEGDFFNDALPARGDLYLLSRIIPDWDDQVSVRILGQCRRSMPDHARLPLTEAVLPHPAHEQRAAIRIDLHMLVLLSGRERTRAEYEHLVTDAGLRFDRVIPTASATGISLIEAASRA